MNNIFKKIDEVKSIQIVVDEEQLAIASTLYTYILRLHKKVSLVCIAKEIDSRYSFLPWFDKVRVVELTSTELSIRPTFGARELLEYFKSNDVKINAKMATALYGALLDETNGFKNGTVDGMTFAFANELLNAGAQHKICNNFLLQRTSLARLRLKAIMFQNMILTSSAKEARFSICEDDFKSTGADMKDAKEIAQEAFFLPYVERVIIFNNDIKENKEIQLGKK